MRIHPGLRVFPYLLAFLIHNSLITPLLGGGDSLEPGKSPQALQLILFEDYPYRVSPPDNPPHYHVVDLPTAEFPQQFSAMYAPFRKLQKFALPEGIEIPRKLILLDIHTLSESTLRGKKVSYRSPVGDLSYQVKVNSWMDDSYQIRLSGQYNGFKFGDIPIQGRSDRAKLVTMRKTARQTLFAVLTPVQAIPLFSDQESLPGVNFEEPKLIEGPKPRYPEGLSEAGRVLIRGIITPEGRLDPDRFVLLECPHPLLGRTALETVLNDWTFQPGTRDGQPVE
ncbi:MAG: energy transducer TonB, partial [Acidobacteria bacterium]|nr:energy transducer TonB [Acidobacteriota bacterium]